MLQIDKGGSFLHYQGMSRNNALLTVSTGLLNAMRQDEAVPGHEASHGVSGEMITFAVAGLTTGAGSDKFQ